MKRMIVNQDSSYKFINKESNSSQVEVWSNEKVRIVSNNISTTTKP